MKRVPDWTDYVDEYRIPPRGEFVIAEAEQVLPVKLREVKL